MEKTIKKLDMIKEYITPTIIFLFGLGVLWASVRYDIVENAEAIEFFAVETEICFEEANEEIKEMDIRQDKIEEVQELILQELVGINVRLDYVIKDIDSR